MNREDREAPATRRPGGEHQQGRLSLRRDRPDRPAGRISHRYRLKRSLEIFEKATGELYLLRLGAGDDLVIRSPSPEDAALLHALACDFATLPQLERRLRGVDLAGDELVGAVAALVEAGLVEVREARRPLSSAAAERFDRQLVYLSDLADPGESADALQAKLGEARVAIIGCGGLGSWVACGLSEIGVGSLLLIDDDRVELSNLNRQVLYTEDHLGKLKIEAATQTLRAHNSTLEIEPIARRVDGPEDLREILDPSVTLVVSTGDWPPHDLPRWVNTVCAELAIPWIGAGQFPPRLRVGPLVIPGVSACLECLETDARRTHPLYDEITAFRDRRQQPDPSVGPVSAVIGSMVASEVMHLLVGPDLPMSVGRALLLDLRSMELQRIAIPRDPGCRTCGPRSRQPRSRQDAGAAPQPAHT